MTTTINVIEGNKFIQTVNSILNPIETLKKARKYGDVYWAKFIGFQDTIVISDPKIIEAIFTSDPKKFTSAEGNKVLKPLFGDYSLLLHDGAYHQSQRKLLTPPFHGEKMRNYGHLMCDITKQIFSQLQPGQPFIARKLTQEISLTILLKTVFGLTTGNRYEEIKSLVKDWLDTINSPLKSSFIFFKLLQIDLGPWSVWGKFERKKQRIYQLLLEEINLRKNGNIPLGDDVLSLMMSAKDESGQGMTDAELSDELMTLLFAGHETTATALAWALYWIHHTPNVKEKLLQEISNLPENADINDMAKLPYLTAVCNETLRIHPVVLFTLPRILQETMIIMDYEFKKGVMLSPCIYLIHHREDIYPQSEKFKPERFLEKQYSPYEFLPFGGSNRKCLGMAFANFELKLVLGTILKNYDLKLGDNQGIKPLRRGVTMCPSNGVNMIFN